MFLREYVKKYCELKYWKQRQREEGSLKHDHYQQFYTTAFGLSREFYTGKRILDIGCGPRGSLEWSQGAAERIGLDPLADEYLKLGADRARNEVFQGIFGQDPLCQRIFRHRHELQLARSRG